MLRHTFRVRNARRHFRSAPFQTATRKTHHLALIVKPLTSSTGMLYDSDDGSSSTFDHSPSTYDHSSSTYDKASIDLRFNKLQKDISTEVKALGERLSMEIKVLGIIMDARFEVANAQIQSKFDTFRVDIRSKFDVLGVELEDREARFWARAIFTVSGLLCICYTLSSNNVKVLAVAGLTSSAAFLQYQNRAIQTPTVQTPAVQAPEVGQK